MIIKPSGDTNSSGFTRDELTSLEEQEKMSDLADEELQMFRRERMWITSGTVAVVSIFAVIACMWGVLEVLLETALPVSSTEALVALLLGLVLGGIFRSMLLANLARREDRLADQLERQMRELRRIRLTRSHEHSMPEGQPDGRAEDGRWGDDTP
ncbi:hypothetical protein GCM10022219_14760 [Microbacterium oryzae]|uniref:Uncharacterized protein n=2 Tax=Microbacterium oryzae TaxID=743009 RepID=A0A6I6E6Z4_9MICO|nr:hypothetical protein D7D94_11325 [Microbacterium oryzae]